MKDSELIKQSISSSACIVEYYKWLIYDKKEFLCENRFLEAELVLVLIYMKAN